MEPSEKYYLFGIFLLLILCFIIYLCGCSFGLKEIRTKDKCIEEFYCDINPDILSIKEK
jgi:hypothetical protein